MENTFLFIGDPGPDSRMKLQVLDALGIHARRSDSPVPLEQLESSVPRAIIFGSDVDHLTDYIVALRERRLLAETPLLATVDLENAQQMERAYHAGVDEMIFHHRLAQFKAVAEVLTQSSTWDSMRAPAGLAVIAHPDRQTRMRVGQLMRKCGFDLHFASSTDELATAIDTHSPRIAIVAAELPDRSPFSVLCDNPHAPPGIVVGTQTQLAAMQSQQFQAQDSQCRWVDAASDLESLVFVTNELLSPKQVSERRTPRILFGTPAWFAADVEGNGTRFWGFTYNVNIGGVFIRTLIQPPLQSRLKIGFRPPNGDGMVALTTQVVWQKAFRGDDGASSPPGIGLQIIGGAPADMAGYETGYNLLRDQFENKRIAYASSPPEPHVSSSVS